MAVESELTVNKTRTKAAPRKLRVRRYDGLVVLFTGGDSFTTGVVVHPGDDVTWEVGSLYSGWTPAEFVDLDSDITLRNV